MILIIDSEKVPDAKITQCFGEWGFESVVVAKTAESARNILNETSNEEISLIIIDSELEDANGFELCREIKKMQAGKDVYIISLVSSVQNITAIEKAKHSGASGFSVKPYNSEEFKKHIFKFIKNKVVLLVEDDPIIRMMVCGILSKYNVEIIEIADGLQAYNLLNTLPPLRLVLMDIGLPNMSGIQLVEKIRSNSGWKKTPVIMLTASSDVSDVKKSLTLGANDYITKPFKVDDFVSRLVRYLPNET